MVKVCAVDALGSAGGVVVGASGWSAAGQHVAMLCFAGVDGKTNRVVQTNPFEPVVLRAAPDGTIWAMGPAIRGWGRKSGELFERFSPDGSCSENGCRRRTSPRSRTCIPLCKAPNAARLSLLWRVIASGAYVSAAEEWVEFAVHGCMTSSGAVFATIHGPGGSTLNELDRAHSQWVAVPPECPGSRRTLARVSPTLACFRGRLSSPRAIFQLDGRECASLGPRHPPDLELASLLHKFKSPFS